MTPEATKVADVLLKHHKRKCVEFKGTNPKGISDKMVKRCVISHLKLCERANAPFLLQRLRRHLFEVDAWCKEHRWPPLSILAVERASGIPQTGDHNFVGVDILDWQEQVRRCILFDGYPQYAEESFVRCPELVRNAGLADRFDHHRFFSLHRDGSKLIAHWFRLAQKGLDSDPVNSFEPFIYAWIAFNGWASCCTDLDQDRQIIGALSRSTDLNLRFNESLAESEKIRSSAETFRALWPIFKVQELRRRRIPIFLNLDRRGIVNHHFEKGAESFAPACYRRHIDNGETIPLDWPHLLAAIYQVRCNLFHGDKAPHSEIDRVLVHSALQTLVRFLSDWEYIVRTGPSDAERI